MASYTVTEADLQAYVDDQLDTDARLEVADYLVRNPEAARRVLGDIRISEALRVLATGNPKPIPRPLQVSASRLGGALQRRRFLQSVRRFAVTATLLVGCIVSVAGGLRVATPAAAAVPTFVEEAMMSYRTSLVRQRMVSQPEVPQFNSRDIKAATHLKVPQLPRTWRLLDVQIFPSDYGPSLQIVVDAGQGSPVALFVARGSEKLGPNPVTRTDGEDRLAYWSRNGMIYVLNGKVSETFLRNAATDLADNQDA